VELACGFAYDDAARIDDMNIHRAGSVALLTGGLVLVFAGLSASAGFSLSGTMASAAAMLALLYAGGVWFGSSSDADRSVLLFTRALIVATDPLSGRRLRDLFPHANGSVLEDACRLALAGHPARLSCGTAETFAISPVRSAEGAVIYGLLLTGAAAASEAQLAIQAC
jgi:hypothetical protein